MRQNRPATFTRRAFGRLAFSGAATLVGAAPEGAAASARARPNIVMILADDLGYGDLSCYGATRLATPNIDRIAQQGMRFTDAHSAAALCCPSRYGLMAGRYPWRRPNGCWATAVHGILLEEGRTTVASMLKSAGYTSGAVGKWHLGLGDPRPDYNAELKPGPLERGFDYCFVDPSNRFGLYVENHRVAGSDPSDPIRLEGARFAGGKADPVTRKGGNAQLLAGKAVSFIERHKDRPFFLYFAPNNIHVPLTPDARFHGSGRCGLYCDNVHELDWMVGEVLATLARLGLERDTLLIFSSDNGPANNAEAVARGHLAGSAELQGQKTDIWEGGHRVPLLARWPGRIPEGKVSGELICLTDMLATLAAATGTPLAAGAGPDSVNALPLLLGQAKGPVRRSVVLHTDGDIRKGRFAVRDGDWLLIPSQGPGGMTTDPKRQKSYAGYQELGFRNSDFTAEGQLKPDAPPGQLYNLKTDKAETTNLYRKHPEIVKRLTALLETIRKQDTRPG